MDMTFEREPEECGAQRWVPGVGAIGQVGLLLVSNRKKKKKEEKVGVLERTASTPPTYVHRSWYVRCVRAVPVKRVIITDKV